MRGGAQQQGPQGMAWVSLSPHDPFRMCCICRVYERSAIEMWFQLGHTHFPESSSGEEIISTLVAPDKKLRAEIKDWKQARFKA